MDLEESRASLLLAGSRSTIPHRITECKAFQPSLLIEFLRLPRAKGEKVSKRRLWGCRFMGPRVRCCQISH